MKERLEEKEILKERLREMMNARLKETMKGRLGEREDE